MSACDTLSNRQTGLAFVQDRHDLALAELALSHLPRKRPGIPS
jgi:hypothetical protein